MKKQAIVLGLALAAVLAIAVWVWGLQEDAAPPRLDDDTSASFDASWSGPSPA